MKECQTDKLMGKWNNEMCFIIEKEKEHKISRKNTKRNPSKDGKYTTKCVSQSTKYSS